MSSHSLGFDPDGNLCSRHSSLDSLLVRVGDGDRDAFAALYDEMSRTVHGISLSGGHEPGLAAEVTLDVFLCAWSKAGSFDPAVESAWTWMRAIARTTITTRSRSLPGSPSREPVVDLLMTERHAGCGPPLRGHGCR
jgi:RNA polymerase sigma-70 factor (ECF subfamily)